MTTVDLLFRYRLEPTEAVAAALARTREVYGIRSLSFDSAASTLRVEYDATRLNSATVRRLLKQTGLEIIDEVPLIPEQVATAV
jgi:hypothetical protein